MPAAEAAPTLVHALFILGRLTFDYSAPATDGLAIESVAQIVIGLWIAEPASWPGRGWVGSAGSGC